MSRRSTEKGDPTEKDRFLGDQGNVSSFDPKLALQALSGSRNVALRPSEDIELNDLSKKDKQAPDKKKDPTKKPCYKLSIEHFTSGHFWWGFLTLFVMFLPFLVSFAIAIAKKIQRMTHSSFGFHQLPIFQALSNFRIFYGLFRMDTNNLHNIFLKSSMMARASDRSALHGFLESAPQLILQLYIFLITGNISTNKLFTIGTSLLFFGYANFEMFFKERIAEEKEGSQWKYLWSVGLLALLNLLASVIIITLLFAFSKLVGLVSVITVIGLSFFFYHFCKFSSKLKMEVENNEVEDFYRKHLNGEISQRIILCGLTSWLVNTVVVKSTVYLQLVSLLISTYVYSLFHLTWITYALNVNRNSLEDFSIIICKSGNSTTEGHHHRATILFGHYIGLPADSKFVRECGQNEMPTDVLFYYIIPILVTCFFIKLTSGLLLSKLSSYQTLVNLHGKKLPCQNPQKPIYYLDAINDPLKFKADLLKWLHKNKKMINKQNHLNGMTIMHSLRPEIMEELLKDIPDKEPYDEFLQLYIKGGQYDIMDYQSRTAHSYWIKYHLPELPKFARGKDKDGSNSPKWLLADLLLGLQPSGKDRAGNTTLKKYTMEILKDIENNQWDNFITMIKYFSKEDTFELMTNIITEIPKKTEIVKILNLIVKEANKKSWKGFMKYQELRNNEPKIYKNTAIHFAAALGDNQLLKDLLEYFQLTDPRDSTGRTPLHWACFKGKIDCVKTLLKFNYKSMVKDQYGWTPLHFANQNGHLECVEEILLNDKVDPDAREEDQATTPLHLACQNGHVDCVKRLLMNDKVNPDARITDMLTPLHLACQNGHIECVKELLLKDNVDPNAKDLNQFTPLHLACKNGHAECVKQLLLNEKVDPDARQEDHITPLHLASQNGHAECVKELLTNGKVSPNATAKNLFTSLHLACQNGRTECVEQLRKNDNVDPNATLRNLLTPLHLACHKGHTSCVKQLLLNKKVDPAATEIRLWTPLHLACQNGHTECVEQLLLEKKVDPNAGQIDQWTPLHVACQNGHVDCVKQLLSNEKVKPNARQKDQLTPLHLACQNGHIKCVKELLLNDKVDPNAKDSDQFTPLHLACKNGHAECVKQLLLKKTVDPDARQKDGRTPLHLACQDGHTECMKELLMNGKVSPDAKTPNQLTSLHLACLNGHFGCATQLLLNDKVDPDASQGDKFTPLHLACLGGHVKCVEQLLLNEKVNPDAKTNIHCTPLHLACKKGHVECVKQLLLNGKVDPNAKSIHNSTPLLLCCQYGHLLCVQELLEHNANVDDADGDDDTPLHVACHEGHVEIVKLLLDFEPDCDLKNSKDETPLEVAQNNGHAECVEILTAFKATENLPKGKRRNFENQ